MLITGGASSPCSSMCSQPSGWWPKTPVQRRDVWTAGVIGPVGVSKALASWYLEVCFLTSPLVALTVTGHWNRGTVAIGADLTNVQHSQDLTWWPANPEGRESQTVPRNGVGEVVGARPPARVPRLPCGDRWASVWGSGSRCGSGDSSQQRLMTQWPHPALLAGREAEIESRSLSFPLFFPAWPRDGVPLQSPDALQRPWEALALVTDLPGAETISRPLAPRYCCPHVLWGHLTCSFTFS